MSTQNPVSRIQPPLRPWIEAFSAAGLVIIAALVSGLLHHQRADRAIHEEVRRDLVHLAKAAAILVDPEQHETFVSREQETGEAYAQAIAPLKRLLDTNPDLAFVYTVRKVGDELCFVLDPTPPGDPDHDGIEDKSHILEVYQGASPTLRRAWDEAAALAEVQPYTDRWGTFLSGYAPIHNAAGERVALIGVDIDAASSIARFAGIDAAASLALGAALAISLLVFIVVLKLRLSSARAQAVQQALLAELTRARDEALLAVRAKSSFLATISHELRTPLNGVIGMTDLLLATRLDPAQRDFGETIRQSGTVLLGLINEVLDYSKLEAGNVDLRYEAFDLGGVLAAVLDPLAQTAQKKKLELCLLVDPAVPRRLETDGQRLAQVLVNLIGNAIKFTSQGHVDLRIGWRPGGQHDGDLCIEVEDTGVGIASEDLPRLFQPFQQLDGSWQRRFGGTGLGLMISRRLVSMLGGEISVQSERGKGSTFRFQVKVRSVESGAQPLSKLNGKRVLLVEQHELTRERGRNILERNAARVTCVGEADCLEHLRAERYDLAVLGSSDESAVVLAERLRAELGADQPRILCSLPWRSMQRGLQDGSVCLSRPLIEQCLGQAVEQLFEPPAALPAAVQTTVDEATRGLSVLVVEDNAVNRKVALGLLQRLGIEGIAAEDGQRALELCAQRSFDLILMDCQMPVLDGFEVTARLRARERDGKRTPILALTANAMPGDRERCLAAGMDDYLSKPIAFDELKRLVTRFATTSLKS